jgi:hypothetical protein
VNTIAGGFEGQPAILRGDALGIGLAVLRALHAKDAKPKSGSAGRHREEFGDRVVCSKNLRARRGAQFEAMVIGAKLRGSLSFCESIKTLTGLLTDSNAWIRNEFT